jgi:hypothetical protein
MTDRHKNWLSIALISAIVAVTSAWAVTEYRVGRLESVVERIDTRVADIYCNSIPAPVRAGCR